MKKIVFSFFLISFLFSCKNNEEKKIVPPLIVVNEDTIPFYPYTNYLKLEIDSIINNKLTLFKTVTDSTNKPTTTKISVAEFKILTADFLEKDLSNPTYKKYFKETVFRDLTTKSIIMNYSNKNDTMAIKNVDVHLDGKDSRLIRVDMKTIFSKPDGVIVTENYAWTFGKEFQIFRYEESKNGKGNSSTQKITWHK